MSYELNKEEKQDINKIEKIDYMLPTLKGINDFVIKNGNDNNSWKEVFSHLYDILKGAEQEVRKLLNERKQKGEINDISQSIKSIAGNAFSNSIVYIFLKNKMLDNIKSNIFITSKKSKVKNFEKLATINVDGETQKPDADLKKLNISYSSANLFNIVSSKNSEIIEDENYYETNDIQEWYSEWDFKNYNPNIYSHGFHQYPAKFIPQLARKILRIFTDEQSIVLDNFSGSGTTLIECLLLNRKKTIGIELNPFACFMAKVKTTHIDPILLNL